MRFRFIIGIALLLSLQGLEALVELECGPQSESTCFLNFAEVDDEDFRIVDENVNQLAVQFQKGVKFLPINLLDSSPNINEILVSDCSIKTIKEIHFKGLSKLATLYLRNNLIENVASDAFRGLVSLKMLSLAGNKIENIASDSFVDLVSLTELYLGGNRIQLLGRHTFASLTKLEKLDLSTNEIIYLHPKIFSSLVNVQRLILDNNEISNLDEKIFESLSNLKELGITENKLKDISVDWFKNSTKLERLSLRGNKIQNIDRTIYDYLPNLSNFDLRYKGENDANWLHISSSKCGVSKLATGLVVFGRNFNRGDYPWTVALTINTQPPMYFCTGTLISSTFVLSAAHCVLQKGAEEPLLARDILAFFGAHDLDNYQESARFSLSPKKIIVHEEWNPSTTQYDADLSLLEFEKGRIAFNDFVQPICFWPGKVEPDEIRGDVVGWGRSEDKTKKSQKVAKVVSAVIQTNEQCFLDKKALVDISSNRTFCAGLRNGSGVCSGDSGGGLVIKVKGISFLKGVVSSSLFKDNDCDVNNNAIYTSVLKYKDWIEKMTGEALLSPAEGFSSESAGVVFCKFELKPVIITYFHTCVVYQTINREDFILGSETDNEVESFEINNITETKFLPKIIGKKFPKLKACKVIGCGLTIVRSQYFKDMPNLKFLFLSRNKIESVEPGAFDELMNVVDLELDHNLIESLDEKLFSKMVKLEKIYLNNNKIAFLTPSTFMIPGGKLFDWVDLRKNVCIDNVYYAQRENLNKLQPDLKANCTRRIRSSFLG